MGKIKFSFFKCLSVEGDPETIDKSVKPISKLIGCAGGVVVILGVVYYGVKTWLSNRLTPPQKT